MIPKRVLYARLRERGLASAQIVECLEKHDDEISNLCKTISEQKITIGQLWQDAEAKAQRIDQLQRELRDLQQRVWIAEQRTVPFFQPPASPPPYVPWGQPIPVTCADNPGTGIGGLNGPG